MKTILTICLIVFFSFGMSVPNTRATDYASLDNRIRQLRGSIEVQIERLKSAREKSDDQMDLAKIRLAEQLRRSEEDLYRQVATLERYREQLADQVTEVRSAMSGYQKNLKSPMEQALSEIEAQVQNTNALMAQMEAAQNSLDYPSQGGQNASQSATGQERDACGCQPSPPNGYRPLPNIQPSPQPQASPRTSRQTPASKAMSSSGNLDPDVQVAAQTEPSATHPAVPETSTRR